MAWFSILPAHLSFIEEWAERIFLMLSILTIGPWFLFLAYDILLYLWRSATYEIPYLGGRARGRQRPRKPSLTERPNGRVRGFSLGGGVVSVGGGGGDGGGTTPAEGVKRRVDAAEKREEREESDAGAEG